MMLIQRDIICFQVLVAKRYPTTAGGQSENLQQYGTGAISVRALWNRNHEPWTHLKNPRNTNFQNNFWLLGADETLGMGHSHGKHTAGVVKLSSLMILSWSTLLSGAENSAK